MGERHMEEARKLIDRLQAYVRLDRAYDPHLSAAAEEAIAAALEAAEKRGEEREREAFDKVVAYAKFVGETFLLDMTAKPGWQDDATWGRQETLKHVLDAIASIRSRSAS